MILHAGSLKKRRFTGISGAHQVIEHSSREMV